MTAGQVLLSLQDHRQLQEACPCTREPQGPRSRDCSPHPSGFCASPTGDPLQHPCTLAPGSLLGCVPVGSSCGISGS